MRDITFLEKPIIPIRNKVLIQIEDTYDLKESKGGIMMANAAHFEAEADSTGHNLSQWIIRSGIVYSMPRELTRAGYDWEPNKEEIKEGDEVYWPIVRFFDYPVIKTADNKLFLLVEYHDLHLKKVDGKPVPINGYYLFTQEKKEVKYFEHTVEQVVNRFKIEAIGEEVKYDWGMFNYEAEWEVGDVCMLNVPPFALEADIYKEFDKEYFLAQKRHILMAV